MFLLRAALACLFFFSLALPASAGTVTRLTRSIVTRVPGATVHVLRIASTGDVQNYTSLCDQLQTPPTDPVHQDRLFSQMIADIIAWRPDIVVMPGDLTDSTGGTDQADPAGAADDVDSSTCTTVPLPAGCRCPLQDQEWVRARAAYDRFIAAGIKVFLVTGNHDSVLDFERHFPKAEWLAYPYGFAEHDTTGSGGSCVTGWTQTSHRVGLFKTAIGNVCLVGMPYNCVDQAWAATAVGCGGAGLGYPTILVHHGDPGHAIPQNGTWTLNQVKAVVAGLYGHQVTPAFMTQGDFGFIAGVAAGRQMKGVGFNTQELEAGAGGGDRHTGGGYWMSWTIDPHANTSTIQSHNSAAGGGSDAKDPLNYAPGNGTVSFPNIWCTDFPSTLGCP